MTKVLTPAERRRAEGHKQIIRAYVNAKRTMPGRNGKPVSDEAIIRSMIESGKFIYVAPQSFRSVIAEYKQSLSR